SLPQFASSDESSSWAREANSRALTLSPAISLARAWAARDHHSDSTCREAAHRSAASAAFWSAVWESPVAVAAAADAIKASVRDRGSRIVRAKFTAPSQRFRAAAPSAERDCATHNVAPARTAIALYSEPARSKAFFASSAA